MLYVLHRGFGNIMVILLVFNAMFLVVELHELNFDNE